MRTELEIIEAIEKNKELQSNFKKMHLFTTEDFIRNAERYINAVKENRIICAIGSISKSGMSRTIKFMECHKTGEFANWYNFYAFFVATGHRVSKSQPDYFTINGCGMDMVFATNYNIIHTLGRLGFLSKEETDKLAQNTPPVI